MTDDINDIVETKWSEIEAACKKWNDKDAVLPKGYKQADMCQNCTHCIAVNHYVCNFDKDNRFKTNCAYVCKNYKRKKGA